MEQQYKVNDVVGHYIGLRDQITALEAETKERVIKLKEQQIVIEAWLLNQANLQGVESFKTDHGTAYVKLSDFCSIADWDSTIQFIKEYEAWNLLNRAVNKTAVREYIDENNVPPPGVNFTQKKEIQVRRK